MVCREENQFVHRQNARDLSEQGNLANKPDHLISRLETTLVWLFVEIPWLCVVPIILCQPIKNIQCISSRLKREIWSLSALKETMILEQSHDVQKPSVLLPTGTKFIGSYGQWKKWENSIHWYFKKTMQNVAYRCSGEGMTDRRKRCFISSDSVLLGDLSIFEN